MRRQPLFCVVHLFLFSHPGDYHAVHLFFRGVSGRVCVLCRRHGRVRLGVGLVFSLASTWAAVCRDVGANGIDGPCDAVARAPGCGRHGRLLCAGGRGCHAAAARVAGDEYDQ